MTLAARLGVVDRPEPLIDRFLLREGFECGIGLENFQDLKSGDIIETFEEREVART